MDHTRRKCKRNDEDNDEDNVGDGDDGDAGDDDKDDDEDDKDDADDEDDEDDEGDEDDEDGEDGEDDGDDEDDVGGRGCGWRWWKLRGRGLFPQNRSHAGQGKPSTFCTTTFSNLCQMVPARCANRVEIAAVLWGYGPRKVQNPSILENYFTSSNPHRDNYFVIVSDIWSVKEV